MNEIDIALLLWSNIQISVGDFIQRFYICIESVNQFFPLTQISRTFYFLLSLRLMWIIVHYPCIIKRHTCPPYEPINWCIFTSIANDFSFVLVLWRTETAWISPAYLSHFFLSRICVLPEMLWSSVYRYNFLPTIELKSFYCFLHASTFP